MQLKASVNPFWVEKTQLLVATGVLAVDKHYRVLRVN